jgi:peptide/nickel transport system substrate-binding protein
MRTSRRIVFLMSLLALVILSVGMVSNVAAQSEKVLVIGHAESTDSLDPDRGFTQTEGIVVKAAYDNLVTFPAADASSIEPSLASSWTISDDGLTYTFTLRDDVKFASGNPLTAADVVFSFNRLINIKGNPSSAVPAGLAASATDDHTVVLTLTTPDPSLLARLVFSGFTVLDSKTVQANGGTDAAGADTADKAEDWLNSHSAGTGPYMLESWEKQVQTVLVRNPNYWGPAPYFDRVIITNIAEAATQKTSLESGDIDMALDITSDQVAGLEADQGITVYKGPSPYVHFLLMNENPDVGGPMSNPKVQQAVRLALDYSGYTQLYGGVTPASVIPVGFLGAYGPDHALQRNVDAAKQLLSDAGYPDGFETTLSYPTYTFLGVDMSVVSQKVQADLAEIGITVSLAGQEIQVALQDYRAGNWGFGYLFWGPDYMDPQDYLVFLPDRLVGLRAQWTEARAEQSILDLRSKAEVTTDPDGRVQVFQQIQDYLQNNVPFAPFLQPGIQTAYKSNIQGYYYHPQWTLDVAPLSRSE